MGIFLFTEAEPSLSHQDIAGRLKLPRSTVYRFVQRCAIPGREGIVAAR